MSFNHNTAASRRMGFFLGSVAGDAVADERLSILGNGNVGIGTSNPVYAKLQIESNTDQGLVLHLQNKDQDSNTYMRYKDWAGQYWDTGINWANNDYYFNYGGAFRARITNAGGMQLTDALTLIKGVGGDQTSMKVGAHNYGDTGKTYIQLGTEYDDGSSRIGSFNNTGNQSTLVFENHAAASGAWSESLRIDGNGNMLSTDTGSRKSFTVKKTFTATGSTTTNHEINLNTLIGASTAGTLHYTVTVGGYASGGANGCNMTYTVAGYSGHNYAAQNYGSLGAGTIGSGYTGSAEVDAVGISYHPCKNLGAYIGNGAIYVYSPGGQRYGFTITNGSSQSMGILVTITGTYT